ncbi:MAG: hypothetical protein PHR53_01445 [Bacteroidales bacterium]|nr:hypothetical protein [Bacteroidales bacterium]
MKSPHFSNVEQKFCSPFDERFPVNIPFITVENFPKLGMLTALRFIEWVGENPDGVISLPTGKTPEYFIEWVRKILKEWDTEEGQQFRYQYGLTLQQKPDLSRLHFVQIDEFYPIDPKQHNSFYNYVKKFYVEDFGLDASKGIFINCEEIPLANGWHFSEVFPDGIIDLGLRYRDPKSQTEKIQQESIFLIDNWCANYEQKIRDLGGIGFFLGGIGPDGHIAFNTRGSDHHSTTRLTYTNFETQAAAAGDLGGIEVSRTKPVITIGLDTITHNPDAVAIIFAAGEAKAPMVADALEKEPSNLYPASVLTQLKNARFYLTIGAASTLKESVYHYYTDTPWNQEKTNRAILDFCAGINKYSDKITVETLKTDPYCQLIPNLNQDTIQSVIQSMTQKIEQGTSSWSHQRFYHTGPHHDDIMLGLLPHIHRVSRNETNDSHFAIMTSGFNAVTNKFLIESLQDTLNFLDQGLIQMVEYPDFFDKGYQLKRDKDMYHYLIKVASGNALERKRGFAHRLVRNFIEIWHVKNVEELREKIVSVINITKNSYDGEKMDADIRLLKGMIREFEEELVWGFFGITQDHIHHLRLGFYTGDIFTEKPNKERDVMPILQQLRTIQPTIISLAFDPEGSGPDTHYKVLQAIAEAVREWNKETDLSHLKIWGYRNVWYQFLPSEATHIVPVSLNAMGVFDNAFQNCYLSQVDASFPSYKLDGKFSELAQQIWVNQLKSVQYILGKPFFYQNDSPRLRTTHGLLFFKEMNVEEFLTSARELEKSMGGQ